MKKLMVCGLAVLGAVAAFGEKWVDAQAAAGGDGTKEAPFQTIQEAIDAASANETIWVRPGDYTTGAVRDAMPDSLTLARVLITKPLRIESTDGATATHIVGASDASESDATAKQNGLGENSVRCVMAGEAAVGSILKGFTIRDGRSRYANNQDAFASHGGGIASHAENALTVVDCVISNNVATRGGACYRVNLVRSLLTHNKATDGGGAATRFCSHYACVIAHNGDATESASKSAVSAPRNVVHCSIFGNGNGGVYLETDSAPTICNSIVILDGNGSGTAYSVNIASTTSRSPTFAKCMVTAVANQATQVTVDTSELVCSREPWRTMVSPYSGDYRAVKGGPCDWTADPTVVSQSWVPEEFRGKDFYGQPFLAYGRANIGAVAASAKAAGGVHVLNGSTAWSVDGYEKNPGYGEKMYVRGTPAESITLRETGENRIFNFKQHYRSDWGWFRVFDNAGKLVIAMPPEGTVVTNWSNGASGVVYADPTGSDANDGSAAIADGNGKGPVKTLKKAVELAADNYIIRCAEGTYNEGTTEVGGVPTRLYLNKQVVVRGAGAGKSIIEGFYDAEDREDNGCGPDAVRCVYAANGGADGKALAVIGFTLLDGCTKGGSSASATVEYEGGAFYAPEFGCRAQLVDCLVTNCSASCGVMYGGWAHRTVFDHNKLCKNASESFRNLAMSACVVKDGNSSKYGYCTVANGGLVIVNTTFAGNGNPYNASSIFGQINGSAQVVLNCVVDGDQQNACTGACADGNWQSYRSGQTGWNYVEAMNLADLQDRDLRPRADSPVVGGGSFGNDAVITGLDQCNNLTADQWYSMVTSTDIDGNPYLYVDGKPTAGAYQRPVAVVTVEAVAAGEVEPTGALMKSAGETVTLTAKGAIERKFLGFWVNGKLVPQGEKTYVFTVPDGIYSKPFVLKAAYNTDWYVNPDPAFGKDTNDGWTPQTAKRSLVAAMKGPVSGDTVHAAIGVYNDGTVADGDNSVTKCRVNVPSGVTLLGDDRDGTIIEGKASATKSSGLGTDSVRGVYLCANAKLKNLTVRKGFTHDGANATESRGAGVLGKSTDTCIVEDCTIRDCRGSRSGGGQYVTFNRCHLIDNYGASTGAAGRNCSYYNTYIVGCSGNPRSMQETTWFVNSTYDVDENDAATVRNLFEGGNARIENSVFLQPNSILSSAVTSASNSVFVTGSGISLASAKCGNVRTNTLEEIALDAVTRVPTAASCLVDAGNTAMVERIGDLDCDCSQRVYNDAIDIGAFEHDWRERYGAVIGATVTAASPEAVERDGAVYLPSGEIAVTWNGGEGLWGIPAEVTGTGVLELYVGDEEEPVHVWMAADEPLLRWPCQTASANLRYRYVPGENDTGGACLKPLTKFVNYLMPEVNEVGDVVFVERATNAIPVTAATAELGDGWYVVVGEVSRAGIDVLPGCTANLVLADGASLTVAGGTSCAGIDVRPGETLNVYGQQDGTGRLVATGGSGDGYAGGAGIGGGYQTDGGTVTICGGSVTAEGGLYAAGIGGGDGGGGGEVTIYGGAVTVVGKKGAQGLGGGSGRGGGTNLIYGGTVRAEGGEGAYGVGGSKIELSENMVMFDITNGEPGVEVTSGNYFKIRKSLTTARIEPVVETFGRGWYVTVEKGVYIGTRFKPGSNTRVEMDVLVGDAQEYWFGCWDGDWDDRAFALGNDATDEVYCGYGSGDTCGGIKGLIQPGRVTVALEKGVVYTNGVVWSAAHADSSTVFALNYNLYLFAQNRKGTAYPGWGQQRIVCYGCKIWTNGMNGATLVRNLVPARTKDAGQVVGLYDMVSGEFFAPCVGALTLGHDEDAAVSVMPGEPLVFDTAAEATNAAKNAVLTPRSDVEAKLGKGSDELETYCNMFGFDVVPTSDGKWAVEAGLMPEPWTNVVESAQAATRQIPVADIAEWQFGDDPIQVLLTNCVPGFYYSLYYGASLTNFTAAMEANGNVLCGTDREVVLPEVTKPIGGQDSGFFTIGVLGIPTVYIPGTDYTITGGVEDPFQQRHTR